MFLILTEAVALFPEISNPKLNFWGCGADKATETTMTISKPHNKRCMTALFETWEDI